MALSSNFYQQIWWTGKGIVRFSDSLALGKASTWLEKALTRKFWNLLERKIEKEKKWRKVGQIVKLQSANNFKSQTRWKCCMSASSVRIQNLAQRWNQKSTTHWADDWREAFPRIERTPICRSKPRRARLHLQSLSYSRLLLSSQTSQSWLPAMKRSATNRGPGRG